MAHKYCQWTSTAMEQAVGAVKRGDMGLNEAGRSYGVPKATLSRHLYETNMFANGPTKFHGGVSFLGEQLEKELEDHCLQLEQHFFGLDIADLRSLAYELAEANEIKHVFSKQSKMAGKKWFYGFMRRHPQLSLRKPENTSYARAQGFNRPRVSSFFHLLADLYKRERITPMRLFNMDETGLSTVQKHQQRVVGQRGKKQVGYVTSGERGESATAVMCVSAAGYYIPPMVIYRRKRMKPELTNGGPPGAAYTCQEKGWMSNEGFVEWLHHFINHAKPTASEKVILVLDGHVSHTKCLEAINLAREYNVIMVSLPPHTTHKLQPLDVTFFGPFKTRYDQAIRKWMQSHVGRSVTTWQLAEIMNMPYQKSATIAIAVSGFEQTGLWPLNMDVFEETEFAPASLTDDVPQATLPTAVVDIAELQVQIAPLTKSTSSTGTATAANSEAIAISHTASSTSKPDAEIPLDLGRESQATPSKRSKQVKVHVAEVSPLPRSEPGTRKRSSRQGKACELTSSPHKNSLLHLTRLSNNMGKKQKQVKAKLTDAKHDKEYYCIVCTEPYSTTSEAWLQCTGCLNWAHELCANPEGDLFVCDFCTT